METKKLPAILKIHDKFFKYYSDEKLDAYYHLSFHNYSENLGRDQYIFHVVLLKPFKITNYQSIFKIEELALQELFSTHSEIEKDESIFSMIVEFTEGANFTPDINVIRNINTFKKNIEIAHRITLNHALAIIPKKFGKTYKVFKFIAKYFSKGVEMGIIVNNYEEAIKKIESIDFIIDSKSFEESVE